MAVDSRAGPESAQRLEAAAEWANYCNSGGASDIIEELKNKFAGSGGKKNRGVR